MEWVLAGRYQYNHIVIIVVVLLVTVCNGERLAPVPVPKPEVQVLPGGRASTRGPAVQLCAFARERRTMPEEVDEDVQYSDLNGY